MMHFSNPIAGTQDCVGLLMVYDATYGIAPMIGISGVIAEAKTSRPIAVGVRNHAVAEGTVFEAVPLAAGNVVEVKLKPGATTINADLMGMPFTSTGQTGWAKSAEAPSFEVGMVCTRKPSGGYQGGSMVTVALSPAIHSATA